MEQTKLKIDELHKELTSELEKFLKGNKSAGTRARKAALEIGKLTKVLREEIQAAKS